MKLLLDECVDRRLAPEFHGHEVLTVAQMGWAGKTNGDLLRLAEPTFDAFVTTDRNLALQQPIDRFDLSIVVMCAVSNRIEDLRPLIPQVLRRLPTCRSGQVIHVARE